MYDEIITDFSATEKGREDLFLLIAQVVKENDSLKKGEEAKENCKLLFWLKSSILSAAGRDSEHVDYYSGLIEQLDQAINAKEDIQVCQAIQ